jgi:RNA polymerase sigma factor (sigma-70 family)
VDPSQQPDRPEESPTERLVREGQAGDRGRFGELYQRLGPAVFAWARLRIPSEMRDQLDPDDVMQEAWIRAFRSFSTFDPERGAFRPWLFQVAKHTLLDMIRRVRVRRPPGGGFQSSAHLSRIRDDVTNLSRRLGRSEAFAQFLERTASLPEQDRLLLVHCGLEGMTVTEAAPRIGLGREAAHKRWQRLRARLKTESVPAGLLDDD